MGITLLKTKNGSLRPKWYGRYTVDGKSRTFPLCRWKGVPPANGSILSLGDEAFERSREEAKALFRTMLLDIKGGNQSQEDLKHTLQIVAQHKLRNKYKKETNEEILICLPPANQTEYPLWEKFIHVSGGCQCGQNQLKHIKSMVKNFIHFILEHQKAEKLPLDSVSGEDIQAFLQSDSIRNLSPRSWNEYLITLRRVFKTLASYSSAFDMLNNIKRRKEVGISREIFTPQEILEIETMAEQMGESLIKSLVIIASCTGLRLKDMCLLQWKSIDLEKQTIALKTCKTGGEVNLPMWPALYQELTKLSTSAQHALSPDDYVLPDAADQYNRNSSNLLDRLHRVLQALGYGGVITRVSKKDSKNLKSYSLKETIECVKNVLNSPQCTWSEKRKTKGLLYLSQYMEGKPLSEIARENGNSKGGIHGYLSDLEKISNVAILRRPSLPLATHNTKRGELRSETPTSGRKNRASLRGWHSFRGSFVMSALQAGANIDTLKKLIGSKNVEVLYEHYVKATPEFMQKGLGQHVPLHALAEAPQRPMLIATPIEERIRLAISRLKLINSTNWESISTEVLGILGE